MKFLEAITVALASASLSSAVSIPAQAKDIVVRDSASSFPNAPAESINELFKRKGGGGKGGGGKGGGSDGGGEGGSEGGSSSGGSSSSGSRPAGSSSGGSSSSGATSVHPTYAGGRYYGGGATTAYAAGARSPLGISPLFLATPLLLFPAAHWAHSAYRYNYNNEYTFYNATATPPANQTKPVTCLCEQYQQCGCDDNTNTSYLDSLIGNGSYAALNKSLVNVADDNGKSTIVIDGTLPNGTAAPTSAGSALAPSWSLSWSGYLVMAMTVLVAVWGL